MRVWHWFAASALWLGAVVAWIFGFLEGGFGIFGIGTVTGTPRIALAAGHTLLYLILFGWILPLCFGLWRLTQRLKHH